MAIQSTLALSPVRPAVYAAVQRAHRPPRRLWRSVLRLLLQYLITVPAVVVAAPFVVLRNLFAWMRKHPAWTFKTAVSTTLVRIAIICMGLIRFAPAPHADSAATGLLVSVIQVLGWRSYGRQIWADTKTLPHLRHLHGRRLDVVYVSPPPVDWLRGLLAVRDPAAPLDEQISFSPLYHGRPMIDAGFAKRRVKCFWYLPRGKTVPPLPDDDTKQRTKPVLLYCHGGAGVSFSAGDTFMGATLAGVLARNADIDVFTVDYDLAPYAKYPTTVVQLFGAWLYLVLDLGYHPSQIFFGGDSYGGMSVLLLNRYLRDVWPHLEAPTPASFRAVDPSLSDAAVASKVDRFSRILEGSPVRPPPATPGILLLSPWLHVDDMAVLFPSRGKAVGHDIVTLQYMTWGTDCLEMSPKYIATNAIPTTSPWISPHYLPAEELAVLPPIWVGNGGAEALLDEGTDLVRRARAAGTDAEHYVLVGMPHDFYTIPFEINNAKKHYKLMQPWFVHHYEQAQARRQGQVVAASGAYDTLSAQISDLQDASLAQQGGDASSDPATATEAVPAEVRDESSDSHGTLTESRDSLAESGVMVAPRPSSPPAKIDLLPQDVEEKHAAWQEPQMHLLLQHKVGYQDHPHPPAPASVATTDDAAFDSAVEPDTPRASSPAPSAHSARSALTAHTSHSAQWHPAEEPAHAREPEPVTGPVASRSQPEEAEPTSAGDETLPGQPSPVPTRFESVQAPRAEPRAESAPSVVEPTARPGVTQSPSTPKAELEAQDATQPQAELADQPESDSGATEKESVPASAPAVPAPAPAPAKEPSKRSNKSKKNNKRKGKR